MTTILAQDPLFVLTRMPDGRATLQATKVWCPEEHILWISERLQGESIAELPHCLNLWFRETFGPSSATSVAARITWVLEAIQKQP